jgi:hypothetical protein
MRGSLEIIKYREKEFIPQKLIDGEDFGKKATLKVRANK